MIASFVLFLQRPLPRLAAPAAVSLAQLYYLRTVHFCLLFFGVSSGFGAMLWALPLLASEYAATSLIEAEGRGPARAHLAAMGGRMLLLLGACFLFFWYPARAHAQPSLFALLIGMLHFSAREVWRAYPLHALLLLAVMGLAYWRWVYRLRRFRQTVTVLLPVAATLLMYWALYFHPAMLAPWRFAGSPVAAEKVFPAAGKGEWARKPLFPHDLHVHPGDDWAMASFGSTFGEEFSGAPSLAWIDLIGGSSKEYSDVAYVRRFTSERSDKLYFVPWHKPLLLEYVPGGRVPLRLPLPDTAGGFPVDELFSVYSTSGGKVFAVNNRNPALFAWDAARGRLLREKSLSEAGLLETGGIVLQIKHDRRRRSLFLSVYGATSAPLPAREKAFLLFVIGALPGRRVLELDDETFALKNSGQPYHPGMDLEVSPDGRWIYVPSLLAPQISKLDAVTLKTAEVLPAPSHCRDIEFSPDGRTLYAGSYLTGEVAVYRAGTGEKLSSFFLTPRIAALKATGRYLYVLGADGLLRLPLDQDGLPRTRP